MRGIRHSFGLPLALLASLALSACGGGGGGSSDATGTLSVGITDAAMEEVTEVHVTFTGVTVKPQSGGQIYFPIDPPQTVDLMKLTGVNYEQILQDQILPAGEYNWIALEVAQNTDGAADNLWVMTQMGGMEPLEIPSGQQSGLRLVSGFTVLANQSTDLMIDWDLKKALTKPRNGDGTWKLRPALRITDMAQYGRIEGQVSPDLVNDTDCDNDPSLDAGNAVYAFRAPQDALFEEVLVDDIDGDADPYATALVKMDAAGDFRYSFEYMGIGDYKLAFTCEAARDEPDVNDIGSGASTSADPIDFTVFVDPQTEWVTVSDGQTSVADFGTTP